MEKIKNFELKTNLKWYIDVSDAYIFYCRTFEIVDSIYRFREVTYFFRCQKLPSFTLVAGFAQIYFRGDHNYGRKFWNTGM